MATAASADEAGSAKAFSKSQALVDVISQPSRKGKMMNQDNRVLNRIGARDLTAEEVDLVVGGFTIHTLTPCIVDRQGNFFNGDTSIGEC
jgi:hypothetical protein